MNPRLIEIEARLAAIKTEIEADGADLDALETEVRALNDEKAEIAAKVEKRKSLVDSIVLSDNVIKDFKPQEERKIMTREDILASQEYRTAFFKMLQSKPLTEAEQRTLTDASGSAGAAVPTQTSDQLFAKMVKLAPMLDEITLLRVAGNVTFVMENVRSDGYLHAQGTTITEASDTFTSVTLAGYEYNKLIGISKTIQTMSINAFEGWIVDMLAEDIARLIENAIINGTGSSQPKGVAYARTYTTTYEISTTSSITYDNVMTLIGMLPAGYDPNAKFLCNKKFVYTQLAAIKDDQKAPILVKDMENGLKFRVMGYPVIMSDKVTDGELYLADFKKIVGNLGQDITVESSMHSGFKTNTIDYRGSALFDSDVANPEAFVRFKKN